MNLGDYELVNEEKVTRAIQGTVNSRGLATGGVGEDASDEAKLAEYDRLGGLIRYKGDRVKMGSFYNFKDKKPFEEPVIMLQFSINGKNVEIAADKPLPNEVRAAKALEQGEAEERAAEEEDEEKPAKKAKRKQSDK